jgi:hypothetical protein
MPALADLPRPGPDAGGAGGCAAPPPLSPFPRPAHAQQGVPLKARTLTAATILTLAYITPFLFADHGNGSPIIDVTSWIQHVNVLTS